MSKVLIDRELLERAAMMELDTTKRTIAIQDELRAILAQPAADCGLEVVAWRIGLPNGEGYKVYENPQPWAYEQYGVPAVTLYEVQELCRISDADARIAELNAQLNQRIETICQMQMELDGVKAQEPVATVTIQHFRQDPSMENIDFQLQITLPQGTHKLYAAPVAKQEVVKGLVEALEDIANDYSDRFDTESPSTNPGMKVVVENARDALAAYKEAQEGK